jgi:hypothetical protein
MSQSHLRGRGTALFRIAGWECGRTHWAPVVRPQKTHNEGHGAGVPGYSVKANCIQLAEQWLEVNGIEMPPECHK